MKLNYFVLAGIVFVTGCTNKDVDINIDEKPKEQRILQTKPVRESFKGSLYSREGASLFADKKDLQIGDILQVNISESLKNDSKNTRSLSKVNNSSLGGGVFSGTTGVTNGSSATSAINNLNANIGIGFNTATTNTFNGSVNAKYDESFETIISAVITQIYENGNYSVKGEKQLLINNEKQTILVSGLIRPYDISPENSVNSGQIANLKILYTKNGNDTDSLKKGWGTKVLESIWPF